YYEDLDRAPIIPVSMNENIPERKRKAFSLLLESLLALRRENKEIIYSSMIKETMKRKKPSFNEEYYGYRTFSEFLEDAQKLGLLELEKHKPSGMYIVTRFGLEMQKTADKPATASQEVDHRSSLGATTGPSTVSSSERARVGEVRSGDEEPTVSSESVRRAGSVPRTSPATATSLRPKHAELQEPLTPLDYPLGRALIDEVAWEDELDEVPSYGATPLLIPKKTATGGPNDTNRPATGRSASGSPQPAPSVAKTVTTAKAATPRSVPTGSRSATAGSASLPSSPAASNISSTSSATPQPAARGGQKRGQGAAAGSRRTSNKAVAAGSTKGKTSNSTADRPHTPSPPSTAMSKGAETRAGAVTSPPTEPTSASSSSFVSAGLESHEEAEFRAGLED
ncbi:MAG: hypothetical protein NZ703_02860, partial [Gemmataceae bacterium]|nr:hypothetical protein [Gemmataceae bacterium]